MSRIAVPAREAAPAASEPLLNAVEKQLGVVPNLFRLLALSPAALQAFLGLNGALGKALDVKTRERIAIAVAQVNGCDYCLSAHTYLGLNLAKIDNAEIALNRRGASSGPEGQRSGRVRAQDRREPRPHGRSRSSSRCGRPAIATPRSSRSSPSWPRTCSPIWSTSSPARTLTSRLSAPPKRRDVTDCRRIVTPDSRSLQRDLAYDLRSSRHRFHARRTDGTGRQWQP